MLSKSANKNIVLALLIAILSVPVSAEYKVKIMTSASSGNTEDKSGGGESGDSSYTQQEREAAWEKFADERGLSYDADWNSIDWSRQGLSSLPEAPYPNSNPTGKIYLYDNSLTDVDGLSSIESVKTLYLHMNKIDDLKGLRNLKTVHSLQMVGNEIKDASPLSNAGLTVENLMFYENSFKDFSSLEGVTITDEARLGNAGEMSGVTKADPGSNFCKSFPNGGGSASLQDSVGYEYTMSWSDFCG